MSDEVTIFESNDLSNDKTDKVKLILKQITEKNGHDRILDKLEVVHAGNGKFIGEIKIEMQHANVYGFLHGGFIATLIDVCTTIAMATQSEKGNGVSVDLNISYINPGKLNDTIVIEAKTIKIGKTLGFSEAILRSKESGNVIAKGSHTKHVANSEKFEIPL